MTEPQVATDDDELIRELKGRLPELIQVALARDEIVSVLATTHVRPEALRSESQENAETLLKSTNHEIAQLREALDALAAHDGKTPDGPNLQPVRRALLALYGSIGLLIAYIVLFVVLSRTLTLPKSFRGVVFVGSALGFEGTLLLFWYMFARLVSVLTSTTAPTSEVFHAGIIFIVTLFPATCAILIAIAFSSRPSHLVGPTYAFLIYVAIVVLFLEYLIALWVPGTRHFYVGSKARREIMRRSGAQALWPGILSVLQETVPQALVTLRQLGRYWRPTRVIIGRFPAVGGASSNVWYGQRQQLRDAIRTAMVGWEMAATERAILPFLRKRINDISAPPHSCHLNVHDAPGLLRMHAQEYVVLTRSFDRHRKIVERLDGGLIGVAGPRGVGKTTLLQAYRAGLFLQPGEEQVVIMENIPVAYDARDFILHLYFQTCRLVVDFIDRRFPQIAAPRPIRTSRAIRRNAKFLIGTLVWALVLGYVIRLIQNPHFRPPMWLVRSQWYLLFAIVFTLILMYVHRPHRSKYFSNASQDRPTDLRSLREVAPLKMTDIRFQQTRTYGWSGKLGLPPKIELSESYELAVIEKTRTYPEIVANFQEFLRDTVTIISSVPNVASMPLVLILDELDKISSLESVRQFIDEAKGFITSQGTGVLCLISVSEDALTSFEQRGIPARDSLDSTFDTIIHMEYLSLEESFQLLSQRIIGMSKPFSCLCHCLAGGLPRELIRVARDVVYGNANSLQDIAADIVGNDLNGKLYSWRSSILRSTGVEPFRSDTIRYLNSYVLRRPRPDDLLRAIENPPIKGGVINSDFPDLARLIDVQDAVLAYLYYCATILQIFNNSLTRHQVTKGMRESGPGSFNTLASVRQLFSVNSRVAWLTLTSFRDAWSLPCVEPPV